MPVAGLLRRWARIKSQARCEGEGDNVTRTTLTGNRHSMTFDPVTTSLPYRIAMRTARALAPLASRLDPKLADAVSARREVTERLSAFGATGRDDHRPLAWFHAPSVGEGLQARAVLDEFRSRHPNWQVAYTWFSPSAEPFGQAILADFADCLPWDIGREVDTAIASLRPQLLVFAKLDVWPELLPQCFDRRDVRLLRLRHMRDCTPRI